MVCIDVYDCVSTVDFLQFELDLFGGSHWTWMNRPLLRMLTVREERNQGGNCNQTSLRYPEMICTSSVKNVYVCFASHDVRCNIQAYLFDGNWTSQDRHDLQSALGADHDMCTCCLILHCIDVWIITYGNDMSCMLMMFYIHMLSIRVCGWQAW